MRNKSQCHTPNLDAIQPPCRSCAGRGHRRRTRDPVEHRRGRVEGRGSVRPTTGLPDCSRGQPSHGGRTLGPGEGIAGVQWPTLGFDDERTDANLHEVVLNASNVSELAPLWTFHTTAGVTDSLAVVNGTAYFGSWNGTMFAVNSSTGALEWETDLGDPYDYTGCNEPGIASTPTIWNNTVYIGGSNPWEYALNASTGAILWHVDIANFTGASSPWTAYKTWSSALVVNGSLYVGAASGCDDPLVRAALLQIDLSNHSIEHISYTVPANDIGDSIWSSPSFYAPTNTVWVTTGNGLSDLETYTRAIMAFNATNVTDVVGYAQEAKPGYDYDFGDGVTIFHNDAGTPMVVALNKNGYAYAFNLSTFHGNVSANCTWTLQVTTHPGSSYSPPVFDGHMLYFGSDQITLPNSTVVNGSVRAVYPGNGTTKWLVKVPYAVFGGLTYANGLIFAGLTGGWGDPTLGGLIILNASNGHTLYFRPGGASWSEPAVLNGEVIYTAGNLSSSGGGSVTALSLPLSESSTIRGVPGPSDATYRLQATPRGGVLPYNVSWSFGDGSSAYGESAVHSYSEGGEFLLTLAVRDGVGQIVESNFTLEASAPLSAIPSITLNPVPLGEVTWLNVTSEGGSPPFVYNWSGLPSDASGGISVDVQLRPTAEGEFNVTSTVTAVTGQSVSVRFPVLWVDGPRTISIVDRPGSGEAPLNVSFFVQFGFSGVVGGYEWDFGDGNSSNHSSPYHLYSRAGSYRVSVSVTYPGGSHATASATVVVSGNPPFPAEGLIALATLGVGVPMAMVVFTSCRRRRGRYLPTGWIHSESLGTLPIDRATNAVVHPGNHL